MMRFFRRLRFWINRRRMAEDLRLEIEAHRAHRRDALERDGRADAGEASRRALGNVTLAREDVREVWIRPWLDSLARDVRHALRSLRRQPGLAAAAVLTIGVGTGALTSVLAVAHTVLLRPPDYPNADRIVQIAQEVNGRVRDEVAPIEVAALADSLESLEHVSYTWFSAANLTGAGFPAQTRMVYTDAAAFALLGTRPLLGRVPTAADGAPDATPVVVISHDLWQTHWGGRLDVVGDTVRVNGDPHAIIGVMPPSFQFPAPYWAPGRIWLLRSPEHPSWPDSRMPIMLAFGLLREGRSIERAQQEVDAVAAALDRGHPADAPIGLRLTTWAQGIRAEVRPRLLLLLGATGLLLLIVCVNVSNLLLSRGLERQRELVVRAALGAGRRRLARQLITEVAVLFAIGGAVGVVAAVWGTRAIVSVATFMIPRMHDASVDLQVAAAGLVVTLVVAILTGLVPALQAASSRGAGILAHAARGASAGRRWKRVQHGLIAGEIAIALVLLGGAGVMVEGGWRLSRADPGFEVDGLLRGSLSLPPDKYSELEPILGLHHRVREKVLAIPGVIAAGTTNLAPGLSVRPSRSVQIGEAGSAELQPAAIRLIGVGYLEALGLRARMGRLFTAADPPDVPIAIVNEAFVRRYFSSGPALGRRVRVARGGLDGLEAAPRMVVGVVGDVREEALYEPAPPAVYVPVAQTDRNAALRMSILVRSQRPPAELLPLVRAAVAEEDPEQAMNALEPLADLMELGLSLNRLNLVLFGSLSAVSVLLAMVGAYGVMAHGVRQRTREIGIRLALGVTPGGIRSRVLRDGSVLVAAGLTCGLVGAVWVARLLRSVVHGIDSTSPLTFTAAAAILAAAGLAGCWVPAWRASRVDPSVVLREG